MIHTDKNSKTPPVISVLLSVYNADKYVSLAIESILNQSFADFELIIVDDCSSDNTYQVAKKEATKKEITNTTISYTSIFVIRFITINPNTVNPTPTVTVTNPATVCSPAEPGSKDFTAH